MSRYGKSLSYELYELAKLREDNHLQNNNTARSYKQSLKTFSMYCKSLGIKHLDQIKDPLSLVQSYEKSLESKYTAATIHTKLAAVCTALSVPMYQISKPRRSVSAITKGRYQADQALRSDPKYHILATIAAGTGLRRSEIASLSPASIKVDESGYTCLAVKGKGGKYQLQRLYPQFEQSVLQIIRSTPITKELMTNKLNIHKYRSDLSKAMYKHYIQRIKTEGREPLIQELRLRFSAYHRPDSKALSVFEHSLYSMSPYRLRGDSKVVASRVGMPLEYDRLALLAVSVFHLSHWRIGVTVINYLLA